MSNKKNDLKKEPVKKDDVDKEMLENLDILLNMDVLESEDDWTHLEKEQEDIKNDKT